MPWFFTNSTPSSTSTHASRLWSHTNTHTHTHACHTLLSPTFHACSSPLITHTFHTPSFLSPLFNSEVVVFFCHGVWWSATEFSAVRETLSHTPTKPVNCDCVSCSGIYAVEHRSGRGDFYPTHSFIHVYTCISTCIYTCEYMYKHTYIGAASVAQWFSAVDFRRRRCRMAVGSSPIHGRWHAVQWPLISPRIFANAR